MNKVIIIGCPGAGKSTFARRLRDKTGLPLQYLDRLWHKPDKTTVSREEFDAALEGILQQERWIIDGNYSRTLERRLQACDTVFLLELPTEVCLAGAAARVGRPHEDLPWTEEAFDPDFRQWIADFATQQLPKIHRLLERYQSGRQTVIFHSHDEIDRYFEEEF